MMKRFWLLTLFALVLTLTACGGDDDDQDSSGGTDDDHAATDDDAADDDAADDDAADDDQTPGPGNWDGVTIAAASAPDQTTVLVALSADPGDNAAADAGLYALTSDQGATAVQSATFDAVSKIATLTTAKQRLGATYTLTISPAEAAPLSADFLAADTAQFYAIDFGDFTQYVVTADRVAVGARGVIYLEHGQTATDVADTMTAFEEQIYPTETALFTEPNDIDGNGRIVILGLDSFGYYGGYFDPTNTYSDDQTMGWWGLHSNEMEMLYIGSDQGSLYPTQVVPHEFQHLLYNARHGLQSEYWDYHDEGLAESAVHAVFGGNQYAVDYYLWDPNGNFANGLSLVHWTWALYDNYALAYLWWIYLAGQLGGVERLGDLFDLDSGDPQEVDDLIADELGSDMPTAVLANKLAIWLQQSNGSYSFNGLLSFAAASAPTAAAGTTSLDLEPFGGAFFVLDEDEVPYPGTQGPDIAYAGVDADGNVDLAAPFDVAGGALVVYNTSMNTTAWPTEHSGPDLPAIGVKRAVPAAMINPAWNDPPPVGFAGLERLRAWRDARLARMQQAE